MDIKTLTFTDTKADLSQLNEYGEVRIFFTTKKFTFFLKLMKEKSGNWLPIAAMHGLNEKKCPFCYAKYESACPALEPFEETLKEILFKNNNIRLKLLLEGITEPIKE